MKLYYAPGACSLSPHIALREAGLGFDLVQVDLKAKKTKAGEDFLAVNPKGQVPVLQLDSGEQLTEGPAIVQWIADQKPAAGLAPAAGTMPRYHLVEWLNFVTSELHKNFAPLFAPNTPEDYKPVAKDTLARKLAVLERHLGNNKFLLGDSFTVVDPYAFTVLGWSRYVEIDLAPYPNIRAYLDRVGARPKVQEALKAEGLLK